VNFYKSPMGRKLIKLNSQLTKESMQKSAQLITPKVKEITRIILEEEMKREMKRIKKEREKEKNKEKKER